MSPCFAVKAAWHTSSMTTALPTAAPPLIPTQGRGWLGAFITAAAINIAGQAAAADLLMDLTKPLLMPLLFVWVWRVADRPLRGSVRLLLVGLVFAWFGDLFLMPEGDIWFMAGIGGFLLMQLFYVSAYRSIPGPGLVRQRPWLLIPFLLYGVGMNLLLDPGAMRIPVMLYTVVLLGMGVYALDLTARVPKPYAGRVAVGAILFIVSDTFIALDAFSGMDIGVWRGLIVMVTYTVAQFLIVTGFMRGLAATDASPCELDRADPALVGA